MAQYQLLWWRVLLIVPADKGFHYFGVVHLFRVARKKTLIAKIAAEAVGKNLDADGLLHPRQRDDVCMTDRML